MTVNTGVKPKSLPVLSTEPVLRKAAVDRGIRFSTEQYGCRQTDNMILTPLERRKRTAQFCNPQTYKEDLEVRFCQEGSTSGSTVFIVSGAPKFRKIRSCTCSLEMSNNIKILSLSYDINFPAVVAECGVLIRMTGDSVKPFTCVSETLETEVIETFEYSRSQDTEPSFCLEISSEARSNSTISVQCLRENDTPNTTKDMEISEDGDNGDTDTSVSEEEDQTMDKDQSGKNDDKTSKRNKPESRQINVLLGAVVGGTVSLLVLVVAVVIIVCIRRRRRDKNYGNLNNKTTVKQDRHDRSDVKAASDIDANNPETLKTEIDDVVTYNVMYNIETAPVSTTVNVIQDTNTPINTITMSDSDSIVTDNVMYNIEPSDTREKDIFTMDQREALKRESHIYHEIDDAK